MKKIFNGTVHGKTIELQDDPGLSEGQDVVVVLQTLPPPSKRGEGWQRLAGLLADDWTEEDDRILEEIYRSRKGGR